MKENNTSIHLSETTIGNEELSSLVNSSFEGEESYKPLNGPGLDKRKKSSLLQKANGGSVYISEAAKKKGEQFVVESVPKREECDGEGEKAYTDWDGVREQPREEQKVNEELSSLVNSSFEGEESYKPLNGPGLDKRKKSSLLQKANGGSVYISEAAKKKGEQFVVESVPKREECDGEGEKAYTDWDGVLFNSVDENFVSLVGCQEISSAFLFENPNIVSDLLTRWTFVNYRLRLYYDRGLLLYPMNCSHRYSSVISLSFKPDSNDDFFVSPLRRCESIRTFIWPISVILWIRGNEFAVSDGYWELLVNLDPVLLDYVHVGKIYDGMKIAILSASLQTNASDTVCLHLRCNGVRSLCASARLGFIHPKYLSRGLSVQSLHPACGPVFALRLQIVDVSSHYCKFEISKLSEADSSEKLKILGMELGVQYFHELAREIEHSKCSIEYEYNSISYIDVLCKCLISHRFCWIQFPSDNLSSNNWIFDSDILYVSNLNFHARQYSTHSFTVTNESFVRTVSGSGSLESPNEFKGDYILFRGIYISFSTIGSLFRQSAALEEGISWVGSEISFWGILIDWYIEPAVENSVSSHSALELRNLRMIFIDHSLYSVELNLSLFDVNLVNIEWLKQFTLFSIKFALIHEIDVVHEIVRLTSSLHTQIKPWCQTDRIGIADRGEMLFCGDEYSREDNYDVVSQELKDFLPCVTLPPISQYCEEEKTRFHQLKMNQTHYNSLYFSPNLFLSCSRLTLKGLLLDIYDANSCHFAVDTVNEDFDSFSVLHLLQYHQLDHQPYLHSILLLPSLENNVWILARKELVKDVKDLLVPNNQLYEFTLQLLLLPLEFSSLTEGSWRTIRYVLVGNVPVQNQGGKVRNDTNINYNSKKTRFK